MNGTLFIADRFNKVIALGIRDSSQKWLFHTEGGGTLSSPTVANGTVYIGSGDKNVYAIDANTGGLKWRFSAPLHISSSPVVADGLVYFGTRNLSTSQERTVLYALDAVAGILKWTYPSNENIVDGPVVYKGTIFQHSFCTNGS